MIFCKINGTKIEKASIEPFEGSQSFEVYPSDIMTGKYRYVNEAFELIPAEWLYTDRPIRMQMAYADVARLGVELPEILSLIKTEGIPVNLDDEKGIGYVYFLFVLPEHKGLLEMYNGKFEDYET